MAKFTNSHICNSMDFNELRIIKAVAGEGSVSRAAERGPLGGRLIIGALETTAAVRLPPVLAKYHRKFQSVDLQLVTGTTLNLIWMVPDFWLDGTFWTGNRSSVVGRGRGLCLGERSNLRCGRRSSAEGKAHQHPCLSHRVLLPESAGNMAAKIWADT